MCSLYQQLRAALPMCTFHPPATLVQIEDAERELSFRLPSWLRELYLCCDGIDGPYGFLPYLIPVTSNREKRNYLVEWNLFLRQLWEENIPAIKENPTFKNLSPSDIEKLHPRHLLIVRIGDVGDWAIEAGDGDRIILYDVRNITSRPTVAQDFLQACILERDLIMDASKKA